MTRSKALAKRSEHMEDSHGRRAKQYAFLPELGEGTYRRDGCNVGVARSQSYPAAGRLQTKSQSADGGVAGTALRVSGRGQETRRCRRSRLAARQDTAGSELERLRSAVE